MLDASYILRVRKISTGGSCIDDDKRRRDEPDAKTFDFNRAINLPPLQYHSYNEDIKFYDHYIQISPYVYHSK